jgi:hypothetical protein
MGNLTLPYGVLDKDKDYPFQELYYQVPTLLTTSTKFFAFLNVKTPPIPR